MKTLTNATVVVTGAAGGIGQALAAVLRAEQCHLALVDSDVTRLQRVLDVLPPTEQRVTLHEVDVTDCKAMALLAKSVVAAHGGIDVLINNAGVTTHGPFSDQPIEDIDWVVDVNLRGVLLGCRVFLPYLKQSPESHIVNISSLAGLLGIPLQATYSATKFAIRGFSAALRVELSQSRVGVSAILPGTVATPLLARARSSNVAQSQWMASKMARHGRSPQAVATAIVRAILRDRAEVIVGVDSWLTRLFQRLCPGLVRAVLWVGWRVKHSGNQS